ncbi:hypothetical protein CWR48_13285 [Oceanobacillus arenosus]|uniref:Uncharacterized protein n=1 Tax=Oceanobacillus arenosus TaxID=1229153 RepID=A0A3D8PN18_9BACI|nr:hypothetical protein CWR48_13285 [Oceanobacillus arenosus]
MNRRRGYPLSHKFDELKNKLKNVDKEQAGHLVEEVREAREDGKIDENEKNNLINSTRDMVKDMDFKGIFNK